MIIMAKIYYKRIVAGLMVLEEVPAKWRNAVEDMLSE